MGSSSTTKRDVMDLETKLLTAAEDNRSSAADAEISVCQGSKSTNNTIPRNSEQAPRSISGEEEERLRERNKELETKVCALYIVFESGSLNLHQLESGSAPHFGSGSDPFHININLETKILKIFVKATVLWIRNDLFRIRIQL